MFEKITPSRIIEEPTAVVFTKPPAPADPTGFRFIKTRNADLLHFQITPFNDKIPAAGRSCSGSASHR